jgi:AcrR family transcriptional regulator
VKWVGKISPQQKRRGNMTTTTATKTKKPKNPKESVKLTRDDWLDAAFSAVVKGGFDAARVLVLADTLGVTRGSFYWHFTDHADLISALLERWRQRELAAEESLRFGTLPDAKADLDRLLEGALTHAGTDLKNTRFELALRGKGRRDVTVARMLEEIDQVRLKLFESKFLRLTGDTQAARDLSALFYLTVVGAHQALARPKNAPQFKEYLRGIISTYLIQRQGPEARQPTLLEKRAKERQ